MESNSLQTFLNGCRINKDAVPRLKSTHTSMAGVKGNYHIPQSKLETFYELYINEIAKGNKLYITEQPLGNSSPLKLDFDIRYSQEEFTQRSYTVDTIKELVSLYTARLVHNSQSDVPPETFDAYVFQRDEAYQANGIWKDGIHIIYPNFICSYTFQHVLREYMIGARDSQYETTCKSLFDCLDPHPLNSIEDFIDKQIIDKAGWLMHGSQKSPDIPPYKLTYIFNKDIERLPHPPNIDTKMIYLISMHSTAPNVPLKISEDQWNEIYQEMEQKEDSINRQRQKNKERLAQCMLDNPHFKRYIERLVKIINPRRAYDYNDWIRIGWALYNTSENLFDVWDDFSARGVGKYNYSACLQEWQKMNTRHEDGVHIGTICHFARQDNEEEYLKITKEYNDYRIEKHIDNEFEHFHVAQVLVILYKDYFVSLDNKGDGWFHFKDHRWREDAGGRSLQLKIPTEIWEIYTDYWNKKEYVDMSEEEIDKARKAKKREIKQLKNVNYQKNILKQACLYFYVDDFQSKLDTNDYLLGFENGIYDLKRGEFRPGQPTDLISMSVGYDYQKFNRQSQQLNEVQEFIHDLFIMKPELVDYVLTFFASCLEGGNAKETFHIFIGSGGNGKSKLLDLMKKVFGKYYRTSNTTMITQKRGSSANASEDLVALKGIRLGVFHEPEKSDKINTGFMKLISGGDDISARGLYKSEVNFKLSASFVLASNIEPRLESNDGGIVRRLRVVPFDTKFVENPNRRKKFELPRDNELSRKLESWKEAMMYLLLKYYKHNYLTGDFPDPRSVKSRTLDYMANANVYQAFFNEKLVILDKKITEKNSRLGLLKIYEEFKLWYGENYSGPPPSRADVKKGLEAIVGEYGIGGNKGDWAKLKWRSIDEESSDEESSDEEEE